MEAREKQVLQKFVHFGLLAALVALFLWAANILGGVLLPFGVAFLLAYILNPVVDYIERKVRSRVLAVIGTLLSLFLIIAVALYLLIPPFFTEMGRMAGLLSRLVTDSETAHRLAEYLPPDLWSLVREQLQTKRLVEIFQNGQYMEYIHSALSRILLGAWGLVSGTTSFLLGFLGLFVILLYLFFMLMDYRRFQQEFSGLIPAMYRQEILEFMAAFDDAMSKYFRAQSLVAASVGVLFAIGFTIIGLPLGFVFGLVVGAMNMVPYLQIVAIPPALILATLHAVDTGSPLWVMLLLTLLVFTVVQTIQDVFLVPYILGSITKLSPVMMLLSLSIWGKLLGFFGLLMAIPFTCLVLAYYSKLQKVARKERQEELSS